MLLSSEQPSSARLIWAPACRGRRREKTRTALKTQRPPPAASLLAGSTHQTGLTTRLVAADVDPQRLLPQCTRRNLHPKHFVDLSHVARHIAARSEEAAGGLHAGQRRHTHITAVHTHTRRRRPLQRLCFLPLTNQKQGFWRRTYILWSAGRQRAPQLNSCTMQTVKRCSLLSYRKASCT